MEQSILVNKPIEDVRHFLLEKVATLKFRPTDNEDEYLGEVGRQAWLLRLETQKDTNRTFLRATMPNPAAASLTRRIFSTLKLVDREEPETFNLRKLRALIETGEIPTIEGQSHGERSALGKVLQPDTLQRLQHRIKTEVRAEGTTGKATSRKARQSKQRPRRKESPA